MTRLSQFLADNDPKVRSTVDAALACVDGQVTVRPHRHELELQPGETWSSSGTGTPWYRQPSPLSQSPRLATSIRSSPLEALAEIIRYGMDNDRSPAEVASNVLAHLKMHSAFSEGPNTAPKPTTPERCVCGAPYLSVQCMTNAHLRGPSLAAG